MHDSLILNKERTV